MAATPADHAREVHTREVRARRAAERQGITISKNRRRDPRALDYNTWQLDDPRRQAHHTGLTLAQIEAYLDGQELNSQT